MCVCVCACVCVLSVSYEYISRLIRRCCTWLAWRCAVMVIYRTTMNWFCKLITQQR